MYKLKLLEKYIALKMRGESLLQYYSTNERDKEYHKGCEHILSVLLYLIANEESKLEQSIELEEKFQNRCIKSVIEEDNNGK